jgi:hypothetical protein
MNTPAFTMGIGLVGTLQLIFYIAFRDMAKFSLLSSII